MWISLEVSKLRWARWLTVCMLGSRYSVPMNRSRSWLNMSGTELNQVWTNLIENAIDAMPVGGELRVRTFHEDHYVVVEIGDSGSGIPEEVRPYIFDPFFTTKGVGEGTGLGLNTVQTIVRKLGGNIQVSSKPGDTRFQVWLPFTDPIELGGN